MRQRANRCCNYYRSVLSCAATQLVFQTRVSDCFLCSYQTEQSESIDFSYDLMRKKIMPIKTNDFARDSDREGFRVKKRDRSDTALVGPNALPELIFADTNG
jgi:hypothetical protein